MKEIFPASMSAWVKVSLWLTITPLFCRLPIAGAFVTKYSISAAGVSGSTALSSVKVIAVVFSGSTTKPSFTTTDGPFVTSGCRNSKAPISDVSPRLVPVVSTILVPVLFGAPLSIATLPGSSA